MCKAVKNCLNVAYVLFCLGYKDKDLINTKFKNIKIFINYF